MKIYRVCRDEYLSYWEYRNTYLVSWLSENVTFRKSDYCDNCDGFLYDESSREKVDYYTPALLWIQSNYEDSLAVGAIKGRRGFFNRFTGEQVLPFDYTRAWLFSEGVAAVTDTADNLFFINKKGEKVFERTFHYSPSMRYEGYMFHNGFCIANDSAGHKGMIGRDGNWAKIPEWDMIVWRDYYWELRRNDSIALLDTALRTIVPKLKATESRLYGDVILVELPHKPSRFYTLQGHLLSDKVYTGVTHLMYRTDHKADNYDGICVSGIKPSACYMYTNVAGECGLLDKNSRILTDALYYNIKAVDYGLFMAQLTMFPNNTYVMLDANGREVR